MKLLAEVNNSFFRLSSFDIRGDDPKQSGGEQVATSFYSYSKKKKERRRRSVSFKCASQNDDRKHVIEACPFFHTYRAGQGFEYFRPRGGGHHHHAIVIVVIIIILFSPYLDSCDLILDDRISLSGQ